MNRKFLLLFLSIATCGFCIRSFAAPAPVFVPQVISPYADFLIQQDRSAYIWTDKPEHGWTVEKRKTNELGYQTFGVVQWLDSETHHILHRSFLPRWLRQDAYSNVGVKAAVSSDGSLIATQANIFSSSDVNDPVHLIDTWTGKSHSVVRYLQRPFVFSPDGKYLVGTIRDPKTYKRKLGVFSIPDRYTTKIIDIPYAPASILWSNDSRTLIYVTGLAWSKEMQTHIEVSMWDTRNFDLIGHATWKGELDFAFVDSENYLQVFSHPERNGRNIMELRSWSPDGKDYKSQETRYNIRNSTIIGFLKDDSVLIRRNFGSSPDHQYRYYLLNKNKSLQQLTPDDLKDPEIAGIISNFQKAPSVPLVEGDFARLYDIKSLRVTKDNVLVADASHVFNALDGKLYNSYTPIPLGVTASDISPNGKFFTSAGADRPYSFSEAIWGVWNVKKGSSLWNEQFKSRTPGIDGGQYAEYGRTWTAQLAFSPDSKRVALSGNLNHPSLAVYDASNGHGIWAHPSDLPDTFVRHFDWSRNGRKLAVAMDNSKSKDDTSRWKIVDAKTGEVLQEHTARGKVLSIAWRSDDSVLLARQMPDKYDKPRYNHPPRGICYLELRNAKTGNLIRANSQTFSEIITLAVSPNRKDVAVAYDDGTLCVWEIATGKLLFNNTSQTVDIAWRGNNQIVTAEANDGVKFWSIPQQKLLATALFMYPWKKDREMQQVMMNNPQWVIYTPDNYYDCSPGAEKYIRWRVGNKLQANDTYKSTFHKREKVMKVLNAEL